MKSRLSKLAMMGLTMAGAIAFGQSNASVSADSIKTQYQGNWYAHQNGRWYHVNVTKNHGRVLDIQITGGIIRLI